MDDAPLVGEEERVVAHRVELDLDHRGRRLDGLEHRTERSAGCSARCTDPDCRRRASLRTRPLPSRQLRPAARRRRVCPGMRPRRVQRPDRALRRGRRAPRRASPRRPAPPPTTRCAPPPRSAAAPVWNDVPFISASPSRSRGTSGREARRRAARRRRPCVCPSSSTSPSPSATSAISRQLDQIAAGADAADLAHDRDGRRR